MQWHPHFAKLLRPLLEGYFDVQVNVPVGDVPREADLVLVRRTATGKLPFHGLWKYLTAWNVLEYKGPTVSARIGDLDLLIELGLGIHRRLREKSKRPVPTEVVSFWYLSHHLGQRFLHHAKSALVSLEAVSPGIWRCRILRRLLFLVSGADLPVEPDSLPFHILEPESAENEEAIARLLISQPNLMPTLGDWMLNLHPALLRELETMARTKQLNPKIKPLVEFLGIDEVGRQLGQDKDLQDVDKETLVRRVLAGMSPVRRRAFKKALQAEEEN